MHSLNSNKDLFDLTKNWAILSTPLKMVFKTALFQHGVARNMYISSRTVRGTSGAMRERYHKGVLVTICEPVPEIAREVAGLFLCDYEPGG